MSGGKTAGTRGAGSVSAQKTMPYEKVRGTRTVVAYVVLRLRVYFGTSKTIVPRLSSPGTLVGPVLERR